MGMKLVLLCAALFAQTLMVTVMSSDNFENQKNFYYSPDPHASSPPAVPINPPPTHGSGGGHPTPTTPSHGGAPPANCGNPPSGGHHHNNPSPPKQGGGGYYHPPPTKTPSTPTVGTPPTIPVVVPGTPAAPSPPSSFDPSSPPFTCIYWRNHPTLIWGFFGWAGSVGSVFGTPTSLPGLGGHMNLLEALSNTRTDGYGELYREGTAALLNSMSHGRFPYTTTQVKTSFVAALSSNKAAAAQARLFKMANEASSPPLPREDGQPLKQL